MEITFFITLLNPLGMNTRLDDVNCVAKNAEGQFKPWQKRPTYGTFLYSPVGHTPIGSLLSLPK